MPFTIRFTVTGPLAKGVLDTVKVPHRRVHLVREQEMPLPRLWLDREKPEPNSPDPLRREGLWTPERWGSSIFDPKWSLAVLERWIDTFGKSRDMNDEVILDIEDVHPIAGAQARDARANFEQMQKDLARRGLLAGEPLNSDVIRAGLRQVWELLLDHLTAYGLDVSVYGHTPEWLNDPHAMAEERGWFFRRLPRTHPVIYEWMEGRPAELHQHQVARERTLAAQRVAPLVPCHPFVTPVLDAGHRDRFVSRAHFRGMLQGAKQAGAQGVVVWYHAGDTRQLARWIGSAEWINAELAAAIAPPVEAAT
ncbi:MAG: hypothetical protein ACKVZJ_14770 [Phycisphaerales bacterium]